MNTVNGEVCLVDMKVNELNGFDYVIPHRTFNNLIFLIWIVQNEGWCVWASAFCDSFQILSIQRIPLSELSREWCFWLVEEECQICNNDSVLFEHSESPHFKDISCKENIFNSFLHLVDEVQRCVVVIVIPFSDLTSWEQLSEFWLPLIVIFFLVVGWFRLNLIDLILAFDIHFKIIT